MDRQEERLIEEVKKYQHLYDSRSNHYKDSKYSNNAWREIAQQVGMDSAECVRRWKNLRDKFVRRRKGLMSDRRGDPDRRRVPAFYSVMSWLEPFVKHRPTTANVPSEAQSSQDVDPSFSLTLESPSPARTTRQSKRKRVDEPDIQSHLEQLAERQQVLQRSLVQDDCASFGVYLADLLRKVPVDSRERVSRKIINEMYDEMDRVRAAAQAQN